MLVRNLVPGSVDVVGDVHGELEVLERLLIELGYRRGGSHPDGRTLVFVGDLIDRGPASLAVVDRVRELVGSGHAQCVIGNHELNVLRSERKEGNDWFFDAIDDSDRTRVRRFFETLPVALEREDLRVVHACWHDQNVASLRGLTGSLVDHSERFASEIERRLRDQGLVDRAREEGRVDLTDPDSPPPLLSALAERNIREQVEHPIKVLTSGLETVADAPFFAGGKWRLEKRVPWWNDYDGPMVVIGHYWRSRSDSYQGKGPDLFAGTSPLDPLGPARRVMCIDYSIGHRTKERQGNPTTFRTALAAYRWPEAKLVFSPL